MLAVCMAACCRASGAPACAERARVRGARDIQNAKAAGAQLCLVKLGRLARLVCEEHVTPPRGQPQGVGRRPTHVLYPPRAAWQQGRCQSWRQVQAAWQIWSGCAVAGAAAAGECCSGCGGAGVCVECADAREKGSGENTPLIKSACWLQRLGNLCGRWDLRWSSARTWGGCGAARRPALAPRSCRSCRARRRPRSPPWGCG